LDRGLGSFNELHCAFLERFGKEGIEFPFPQGVLNFRCGWGGEG
jgi:small-conductance mechanosensitive channel